MFPTIPPAGKLVNIVVDDLCYSPALDTAYRSQNRR